MSVHLTREEVARKELGRTEVTPRLAWIIVAIYLATMALPPCLQIAIHIAGPHAASVSGGEASQQSSTVHPSTASLLPGVAPEVRIRSLSYLVGLIPSARQLREFEDRLNEASLPTQTLAPWVGWAIKGILHGGDEQAYFGRGGWLFYRPSVDSVTGPGFLTRTWQQERLRTADKSLPLPQPDPLKALIQFHGQLAARGIALVVIPTPGKESLHPEKLAPQWSCAMNVVQNPSFELFKAELAKAGIDVFDPAPLLEEMNHRTGGDVYLKTDTHWTAPAMEHAASRLANWMQERGLAPAPGSGDWQTHTQTVFNTGDIAVMLNLPKGQRIYPAENVQITRVVTTEGRPWEPDATAPVLLMGDSFCNIYSLAEMGWGDSAGFAEHLSMALRQPIDRLAINAGGAYSARQELVRELASGRDRLAGKRVVLYQFAARELAFGDWKLLDLPQVAAQSQKTASVGGELVVQGRVSAIARLPQPGSVPYKDCLIAIHLTQVRGSSSGAAENELLVYAMGMRDNRWMPVSSLPVGGNIQCRLSDWAKVEKKYGGYNRAELDDLDLLSLPTFWLEEVTK